MAIVRACVESTVEFCSPKQLFNSSIFDLNVGHLAMNERQRQLEPWPSKSNDSTILMQSQIINETDFDEKKRFGRTKAPTARESSAFGLGTTLNPRWPRAK